MISGLCRCPGLTGIVPDWEVVKMFLSVFNEMIPMGTNWCWKSQSTFDEKNINGN